MDASTDGGKKLSELRVIDLKQQLEKRSLDICGVKLTLQERLKTALVEEGNDPETFLFGIEEKASPTKSKAAEEVASGGNKADAEVHNMEVTDDADKPAADTEKTDSVVESRPDDAATTATPSAATDNNIDNEDSLNLTIGEDEAKLFQGDDNDDKEIPTTVKNGGSDEETKNNSKSEEPKSEASPKDVKTESDTKADAEVVGSSKDGKESVKSTSSKSCAPDCQSSTTTASETNAASTGGTGAAASDKATPSTGGQSIQSPGSATGAEAAGKGVAGRNLWVSGLSSTTRATDLKQLFSKYGKVVGAKVVTNTKMPGSRCYGYVTMNAAEEALKCVEHLNRTELHGRMISVEKAKTELGAPKVGSTSSGSSSSAAGASTSNKDKSSSGGGASKKSESSSSRKPIVAPSTKKESTAAATISGAGGKSTAANQRNQSRRSESGRGATDKTNNGGSASKDIKADSRRTDRSTSRTSKPSGAPSKEDSAARALAAKERELQRERDHDRIQRQRERDQFEADRLRHEREKARLKEKLEEEEKRTREARRRAKEEEERLARERKKIQLERARLEREKAELLRLERQKLEREKLELERQEIKRQQMKVEEAKRNLKRPAELSRESGSASVRYDGDRDRERDRKRSNPDRQFGAPPPPPRFESSIRMSGADKKRDEFPNKRQEVFIRVGGSSRASREEFVGTSSSKRADDYGRLSSKREDYDSPKRSSDDYGPSSKRDRRDNNDYKRNADLNDLPVRLSSSSSGGGNYNPISSHGRGGGGAGEMDMMVIQKPYDHGTGGRGGGGSNEFRRNISTGNNMNNVTLIGGGNSNNGGGGGSGMANMLVKDERSMRYIDNGPQNDNMRYGNNDRGGMSAPWNNQGPMGGGGVKPFGNSGPPQNDPWKSDDWRSLDGGQDRYDRTYNERKLSPYMEPARQNSGSGGGSYLSRPQDRYNSMPSRFDSGRF